MPPEKNQFPMYKPWTWKKIFSFALVPAVIITVIQVFIMFTGLFMDIIPPQPCNPEVWCSFYYHGILSAFHPGYIGFYSIPFLFISFVGIFSFIGSLRNYKILYSFKWLTIGIILLIVSIVSFTFWWNLAHNSFGFFDNLFDFNVYD